MSWVQNNAPENRRFAVCFHLTYCLQRVIIFSDKLRINGRPVDLDSLNDIEDPTADDYRRNRQRRALHEEAPTLAGGRFYAGSCPRKSGAQQRTRVCGKRIK